MWIFENSGQALMALGLFLAVLDVLVFGFATLFLTLLGLGMLTTGALISFGFLTDTSTVILIAVAIFSVIYGVVLWKPLKQLQENKSKSKVKTDLTGMLITLEQDVSPEQPGKHHYSGVDWQVISTESLAKGAEVEVYDLQVGVMKVRTKP